MWDFYFKKEREPGRGRLVTVSEDQRHKCPQPFKQLFPALLASLQAARHELKLYRKGFCSSDFCFHSGGHEIPGLASSGRFYLYAFVTLPGLGEFFSRDLLCPQLSPLWSPELYVLEFLLCGLHTSFCCVGVTTMGGLVGVTDPLVRLVPGLAFCRSCWLIVTRAE